MTQSTEPTHRRRLLIRFSVLGGVLTLVAAVPLGLLKLESHERSKALTEACDGVLAHPETRAVLGDPPYRKYSDLERNEGHLGSGGKSLAVRCKIGGSRRVALTATVNGMPSHGHRPFPDRLYPRVRGDLPPQPLGSGWRGVFVNQGASLNRSAGDELLVAVVLKCREAHGDLLITVEGEPDTADGRTPVDDPRERVRYARVAAATAERANTRWGCGAATGRKLHDVALPVNGYDDVPLDDAKGTCAGVPGQGERSVRAWEGARLRDKQSGAPLERCLLGRTDPTATAEYELEARYGPYAGAARESYRSDRDFREVRNPATHDKGRRPLVDGYWASAACRGDERALYTIRRMAKGPGEKEQQTPDEQKRSRAYERAALKAFAERSAASHGCKPPALP